MQASGRIQRRSSFDIVSEILTLCHNEQSKTAVVYKCNLNFKLISGYLEALTNNGLLIEVKREDRTVCKSTEKGVSVSYEMNRAKELVSFMHPDLSR